MKRNGRRLLRSVRTCVSDTISEVVSTLGLEGPVIITLTASSRRTGDHSVASKSQPLVSSPTRILEIISQHEVCSISEQSPPTPPR